MFGCTYGQVVDDFINKTTSPIMTCFFLLSGFTIHYQYGIDEIDTYWIKKYYYKRLISILPSYLLVVIIWPIVYPAQIDAWVSLLPIELFGLQTAYHSLFGILHNGGTWFVSCLFFAYMIYPVIKMLLKTSGRWMIIAMIILPHFFLIYSNIIIPKFSLESLYSNPIARSAEFIIGAVFCELVTRSKSKLDKHGSLLATIRNWGEWRPFCLILLLSIISVILASINHENTEMMIRGYLIIPGVLFLLLISTFVRSRILEKNRLLSILSGMSYQFFLVQCFLWDLTAYILNVFNLSGNDAKKTVSLITCVIVSFMVYMFFDKPIRKLLLRRISRSRTAL